ncbi:hypothetical protein [Streptomyces sp. Root369]|nr:hypothetical protein [Streptomyces sp. Root369]
MGAGDSHEAPPVVAALTLWRHVLAFPHPPCSGEPQLLLGLRAAGASEDA